VHSAGTTGRSTSSPATMKRQGTTRPVPALCTNDEVVELNAVLSGKVIGQLAGVTAAPHIRSGQLVPLLIDLMPDRYSYFIYYGSRSAQPARVRAFVDLAVARLVDNREHVLSLKELKAAQRGRRVSTD
jgi:DNA-binding transcriptional LysR family regulator